MIDFIWIAVGGFVGAVCRYAVVEKIGRIMHYRFPAGTMLVNVLGSFLLGLLYGWTTDAALILLLGIGFMGSFTTFSTFQFEIVQLGRLQKWGTSLLYALLSVGIGVPLAYLGLVLGELLAGG